MCSGSAEEETFITVQFFRGVPLKTFCWVDTPITLSSKYKNLVEPQTAPSNPSESNPKSCPIHPKLCDASWSPSCVSRILQKTFYHKLFKYPPSQSYQKSFLKRIIECVESSNQPSENDYEELYDLFTSLLFSSNDKSTELFYKSYLLDTQFITIQEKAVSLSEGTTGLVTWLAGEHLAKWCLANTQLFSQKRVLELGSGCGLTGLAVLSLNQAEWFTFTDVHDSVLTYIQNNVEINNRGLETNCCDVRYLSWDEPSSWGNSSYDIILGADIVFDVAIVPCLVDTLSFFLSQPPDDKGECSPVAYISSTVRNESTYSSFLEELKLKELTFQELDSFSSSESYLPPDRFQAIKILKIFKNR